MAKDQEVATTQQPGAVAAHSADRRGFEGMNMETLKIPTAKLLQSNSPEVTEEDYADYGFRAGQVIHSLMLDRMPEKFIPILIKEPNAMMTPRSDQEKVRMREAVKNRWGEEILDADFDSLFICRAEDGKCGDRFGNCANCQLNKFRGNEKPVCTANIEVLAMFEGQDLPVVIRFSNTSYKHGATLKNLAFYAGCALFGRKYKLGATKRQEGGNTWYEFAVKPAGKVEGDEFAQMEAIYDQFFGRKFEAADGAEATAPTGGEQTEF
jgi:hypothetical protein